MKCPLCQVDLKMSERHGVEIDYCPKCRGVWLDRGELDKIIERATEPAVLPDPDPEPAPQPAPAPQPHVYREPYREERPRHDKYERRYSDGDSARYRKKKRRKSFLEEIFDFD